MKLSDTSEVRAYVDLTASCPKCHCEMKENGAMNGVFHGASFICWFVFVS